MGAKDSKLNLIPFEDANKRVSHSELKRLKETFKRSALLNGCMRESSFKWEVLSECIPPKLTQLLYKGFGGTSKGLQFRDLFCGLVVLTQGTQEEKIKLLFAMYANETFTYIVKHEMDKLLLDTEGSISPALSTLFKQNDQIDFEHFKYWIIRNPDATVMSKWLLTVPYTMSLSSDCETPTFYQILAGVTHLDESEITVLEKRFWQLKGQSRSGVLDFETFKSVVSPPIPYELTKGLFDAFDENQDGHIDFKELACGVSASCKGPLTERHKFAFKVFDSAKSERLYSRELLDMVHVLISMCAVAINIPQQEKDMYKHMSPQTVVDEILQSYSSNQDYITLSEYLVWTLDNKLSEQFTVILSQVCHVILGLQPRRREEEGSVIKGWLSRDWSEPLKPGCTWYIVSTQWWNTWLDYVNCKTSSSSSLLNGVVVAGDVRTRIVKNHRTIDTEDDSPVTMTRLSRLDNVTSSPSSSTSSLSSLTHSTNAGRPSAIDNNLLLEPSTSKVSSITKEGNRIRCDKCLKRGQDYELLSPPVWEALHAWYGGSLALPRDVTSGKAGAPSEIELYPIFVKLLKHQTTLPKNSSQNILTSFLNGFSSMALSAPRRVHVGSASFSREKTISHMYDTLLQFFKFSREDVRLWKFKDEMNMTVLDEEDITLEAAGIEDNQVIVIEIRNKDLTWPEEMYQLARNKSLAKKDHVEIPLGATGLSNLGNTCFMNSALQCLSNAWPLTQYFRSQMYLYEINKTNPQGMRGQVALRYGDLVKDLWMGTSKSIAPFKFRWTIGKYAPQFNGFEQHDSQEFLSFLLDGLHEDLNRVCNKPYEKLKDSEGRADDEVALEAWDNYILRNQSILVDLFHGQLKSEVRCKTCGNCSSCFDPFTFLSLPLPLDNCIQIEVTVFLSDGSVPYRYGVRLGPDDKYQVLKMKLSELCHLDTRDFMLIEVLGHLIHSFPRDSQKIKQHSGTWLCAYDISRPHRSPTNGSRSQRNTLNQDHVTHGSRSPQDTSANDQVTIHTEDVPYANEIDAENNESLKTNSIPAADVCSVNDSKICDSPAAAYSPTPSQEDSDIERLLNGCIIAVHRKMIHRDVYFLASQRTQPNIFGIPLIIPCHQSTTNAHLYQYIWKNIARLVSSVPRAESKTSNHAQDCDDSLAYEYPFLLKTVELSGYKCAKCPWYCCCRGCALLCNNDLFNKTSLVIAIDWEPTALHLRYQTSSERHCENHASVQQSRQSQLEPIDLDSCLRAFTQVEDLGEDELYDCSKCKKRCPAVKKLDIWRLPPMLIINLKRFQFVNGRWIKSQKIVNFPFRDFDPARYLSDRNTDVNKNKNMNENHEHNEYQNKTTQSGAGGDELKNRCTYSLYALSCHSGNLGGGHYVAYAKNINGKWYIYNDSSCKEIHEASISTNSAYILFYIKDGVDFSQFYPDLRGKTLHVDNNSDSAIDLDIKKCLIQ